MKTANNKQCLFQQIETLREKLHYQTDFTKIDFTKHDALKVSIELDRLILKAMKNK